VRKVEIAVLFLLLVGCAKKAPPPSPDRWSPRVRDVEAVNRRHLKVRFSESVDSESSVQTSNYACFESTTSVPLQILAASMRNSREIDLTTSNQSDVSYTLVVSGVKDQSDNEMAVQKVEFVGTKVLDTHPPRIVGTYPADGSAGIQADSAVIVRFSEFMDSTSVLSSWGLLPEGHLNIHWDDGFTEFRFFPEELQAGEVYTLYLTDGCRDLEGNRLEEWSFLTFTSDSALPQGYVSGYLRGEERGRTMIALVDSLLRIERIAVLSDSTYRIDWLKPAHYTLLAGTDLDDDRKFDLVAHADVEIAEEGVIVELLFKKEKERWRIFERLEMIFAVD
jgi:hypothetical protein